MKLPDRYVPQAAKSGGGMSNVTLCRDTQLDRDVIIKALAPGVDKGRLLDEIRALQTVRSGYVVQIYDVIAGDDDEIAAVVEEYVAGQDLSDLIGHVSLQDFYRYGYELSTGIAEVHDSGVIHRDIKPHNVRVGETGCLTIIDFGLARQAGDDAKTVSDIGTAGYMAPELFEANPDGEIEFTEAVDVFAFGSTMFVLAEGKLPRDLRRRPPTLPCEDLDFCELDVGVSTPLAAKLNECFCGNPTERPTARQISDEFKRVLLHDRHRALINIAGGANYLDASNRKVTASVAGLATVVIEYDGDDFLAAQVTGDVYVNNSKIAAGYRFPGSCVIAFGAPELGSARAYVTFDVSHPGVEV